MSEGGGYLGGEEGSRGRRCVGVGVGGGGEGGGGLGCWEREGGRESYVGSSGCFWGGRLVKVGGLGGMRWDEMG